MITLDDREEVEYQEAVADRQENAIAVKERPILFSGAMVRALLDGTKTQTRRVVKHQPSGSEIFAPNEFCDMWYFRDAYYACPENDIGRYVKCPYGKQGDRLWVRETFFSNSFDYPKPTEHAKEHLYYRADGLPDFEGEEKYIRWVPSIHMPRWASRITLEIVSVRVERLQEISEEDAIAEGIRFADGYYIGCLHPIKGTPKVFPTAVDAFCSIWDSINAERGYPWESNPFVWVLEFRRVKP